MLLLLPLYKGVSQADGISGLVELDYDNNSIKTTDQAGNTTRFKSDDFIQKYYLNLDRSLYPNLRFNGGGIFEKTLTSTDTDGTTDEANDRKTNLFANIILGGPVLSGSGGYNRREEMLKSLSADRIALVNEEFSFYAGWKPAGLPQLDLRLDRTNTYDDKFKVQDTTTDTALFNADYKPVRQLDLRYSYKYDNPLDRINGVNSTETLHTARFVYSDDLFDKRTSVYASYYLTNRTTDTTTSGTGGFVSIQQFPIAGLSLIETFPATPESDTLIPNPALIDGNLITNAGLNIGFSVSAAGDNNIRDIGVQFADNITRVNTLFVWVDKSLPPAVVAAFPSPSFQVFVSDDNVTWVNVPAGPVVFGEFQNRFEITMNETRARYIKVLIRPLQAGVVTNPQFSNIFVTEMQTFDVVGAAEAQGKTSTTSSVINATARTRLPGIEGLYHDFSLFLTHTDHPESVTTYLITNGLTLSRKLGRVFAVNARVADQETELTTGHERSIIYSSSLTATPIPTLSHSLVYSGQTNQKTTGTSDTNTLTLFNKAELYKGVSVLASLGYNFGTSEEGQSITGTNVNINASITPHPTMTLTASYINTHTSQSGGGRPSSTSTNDRVEGTVSFTPVKALYLTASISETTTNSLSKTLTNFGANFSPFPDGDLQLHFAYTESLGPANEGTTKLISPSLRWNIRSGTFLDVSYTVSLLKSSIQDSDGRFFNASLKVAL